MKNKIIRIERLYKSSRIIIPIGCDCHPAYALNKLHLRKYSLPFDWLNSKPETNLYYVMDCLRTKFEKAFLDIYFDEDKRAVSRNYPNTQFFHEPSIAFDNNTLNKFIFRGKLLCELVEKMDVSYLCNIKMSPFQGKQIADKLLQDIAAFSLFMKQNDSLYIYFTTEDNREENQNMQEYLFYHGLRLLRTVSFQITTTLSTNRHPD